MMEEGKRNPYNTIQKNYSSSDDVTTTSDNSRLKTTSKASTMSSIKTAELQVLLRKSKNSINPPEFTMEEKTNNPESGNSEVQQNHLMPRIRYHPEIYPENILNQEQFDKKYGFSRVNLSLLRIFEYRLNFLKSWHLREWKDFFKTRIPILEWLPSYDFKKDLVMDVVGGLMIAAMNVPQGLAYGFLVGLPPIYGLYTGIIGPFIYSLLGTSKHTSPGLTSGAAIHVLTSQIPTMTGVSGVPHTSEINGIIKFYICFFNNFKTIKFGPVICSIICIFVLIFSKEIFDKAVSKWFKVKFPMELFVIIFSIFLTWTAADTVYDFHLDIVGTVEPGMKTPIVPDFSLINRVIGSAISIAIVSFVIHISLAKLISKKFQYPIDSNQEWLALGTMHTVSAWFGCFAGGSSLSRTMTQVRIGTRSQLSTIVSCILLIFVVYGLSKYLEYLPKPILACIVVVALKDLIFQIYYSLKIFHKSFIDFLIWLITFLSVILINVNIGLIIGVTFALLTVVFRSQWPESQLLGRIPGTCDFKGLSHYITAEEVPGVFVYRFDAPLYFANSELFLNRIRDQLGLQPYRITVELKKSKARLEKSRLEIKNVKNDYFNKEIEKNQLLDSDGGNKEISLVFQRSKVKDPGSLQNSKSLKNAEKNNFDQEEESEVHVTHIVVDCSSFPYIDLMGLEALEQVHKEFGALNITVYYACLSVRQMFEQNDFYQRVPKKNLFVSVWDAVNQAQKDRVLMFFQKNEDKIKTTPWSSVLGNVSDINKVPLNTASKVKDDKEG